MKLPLSTTTYFILAALGSGQRKHAYGIVRDIRDATDGKAVIGLATFYANLERLLSEGLVERDGEAEVVDGRARQYFRITALGGQARADDDAVRASVKRLERGFAS